MAITAHTTETLGLRSDLRVEPIAVAAIQAAEMLAVDQLVEVAFAPGDATQYQLLLVQLPQIRVGSLPFFTRATDTGLLVVPLNLPGRPLVWDPRPTWPAEVTAHHALTDHQHTGEVYAAFLTLLAEKLGAV